MSVRWTDRILDCASQQPQSHQNGEDLSFWSEGGGYRIDCERVLQSQEKQRRPRHLKTVSPGVLSWTLTADAEEEAKTWQRTVGRVLSRHFRNYPLLGGIRLLTQVGQRDFTKHSMLSAETWESYTWGGKTMTENKTYNQRVKQNQSNPTLINPDTKPHQD